MAVSHHRLTPRKAMADTKKARSQNRLSNRPKKSHPTGLCGPPLELWAYRQLCNSQIRRERAILLLNGCQRCCFSESTTKSSRSWGPTANRLKTRATSPRLRYHHRQRNILECKKRQGRLLVRIMLRTPLFGTPFVSALKNSMGIFDKLNTTFKLNTDGTIGEVTGAAFSYQYQ